jgi:hypothetical protein
MPILPRTKGGANCELIEVPYKDRGAMDWEPLLSI